VTPPRGPIPPAGRPGAPPAPRSPPKNRIAGPPGTTGARRGGFKFLRIAILLWVLFMVALMNWHDRYRSTRWREPLYAAIYPIAADESPVTRAYLATLDGDRFKSIDRFFSREAERYHLGTNEPVRTRLRSEVHDRPPQLAPDAGPLATAVWSLRLRFWTWRQSGHVREPEDIRLFVLYHDPALTPSVPHSLGLAKGLTGVVYLFAAQDMGGENNVVIAHELLHTVGATDKYNLNGGAPHFPDGYGDPAQVPVYPQRMAELMAGKRMLAPDKWQEAASLDEVLIGPATALEIRWAQRDR
jgi:hypothetical protein